MSKLDNLTAEEFASSNLEDLMNKYNCSAPALYKRGKQFNLKMKPKKAEYRGIFISLTQEEINTLSIKEIAEKYNTSTQNVSNYCRKYNLRPSLRKDYSVILDEDYINLTASEIVKKYGLNQKSLYTRMRNLGIAPKKAERKTVCRFCGELKATNKDYCPAHTKLLWRLRFRFKALGIKFKIPKSLDELNLLAEKYPTKRPQRKSKIIGLTQRDAERNTIESLAMIYNVKYATMAKYLKEHGLKYIKKERTKKLPKQKIIIRNKETDKKLELSESRFRGTTTGNYYAGDVLINVRPKSFLSFIR